jgi:hypothetical protein
MMSHRQNTRWVGQFLFKRRLCEVHDNKANSGGGEIFQLVVGVATVQDSIPCEDRNFLFIAMFQLQRTVHGVLETFSRGEGGGQNLKITTNPRQLLNFSDRRSLCGLTRARAHTHTHTHTHSQTHTHKHTLTHTNTHTHKHTHKHTHTHTQTHTHTHTYSQSSNLLLPV